MGDALERRLDFDAAYWFQYFDDDILMTHFSRTLFIRAMGGYAKIPIVEEHPEWGCMELVTELPEAYPGREEMARWLATKGAIGYADMNEGEEDEADLASEYVEVYLSRADALAWLRQHRPDLYADVKSMYSLPDVKARFFP